jgi:cell division protein FtsN
MAKDYKDTSKAPKRGGGVPGPIWFVAGFALGVILTVVYRVGTPQVVERELARNAPADAPSTSPAATAPTKFDFYGMLEDFQVVVPGQIKPEPKPAAGGSAAAASIYVLQVGAFRTEPEADKLRAQLALLGVEAKIQKNVVDDKDTWFRVRVGPIKDEAELARLRARLDENKIKFMTLRGSA